MTLPFLRSTRMRHRGFKTLFVLTALIVFRLGAFAQSTTEGAIGGTVYDPVGAVVPNATVVVHNNGTNVDTHVTTDTSGYYRANQLAPAIYTVTISSQGFAAFKAEQVVVSVGSLTNVSPRLGVAGAAETVSVTGE